MIEESKTLCDDCIHRDVCGDEGCCDPAMVYCRNRITEDVAGFIGRKNGLLLITLMPLLTKPYFTVVAATEQVNDQDTYEHPANYKVISIDYSNEEGKLMVVVDKIQ